MFEYSDFTFEMILASLIGRRLSDRGILGDIAGGRVLVEANGGDARLWSTQITVSNSKAVCIFIINDVQSMYNISQTIATFLIVDRCCDVVRTIRDAL